MSKIHRLGSGFASESRAANTLRSMRWRAGSAAGVEVECSVGGGTGDGALEGNEAMAIMSVASSSWATWACSSLFFLRQSRAQWPFFPQCLQGSSGTGQLELEPDLP